ncbi:aldehyde dehydrogenase [Notoacmeibacter sp. MSK16QG-6]|uniref:aldehyde dehydrogenase n=1 Tax=Notoacmeibacter sp. MSK16QG-6 TaxID=2957982 RepID=UPI00209CB584|nr:aldehyde dehydrogenase [Notoacmeibacter sp. MSK16QG-6]MCP1199529.1 aldehyde dehydrogenase [Notoacmeibacter sp. MSK16QG-6]
MTAAARQNEGARSVSLLIAGEDRWASDGETFCRVGPLDDRVVTEAAAATPDDAIAAVDAAAAAFPEWSQSGPRARRRILLRAAEAIRARREEFIAIMCDETGAAPEWAAHNVELAADMLMEAAAITTQVAGEMLASDRPATTAMAVRQPAGVVLSIAPWNAPIILSVRSIATPLACGNTLVLKSSEICPATHRLAASVICEAGLPTGALNVISHAPEDAETILETIVSQQAVRRVNFTGSTRVGRIVAEIAAKYLKRPLLELGGKAPLIVLDDADLDAVIEGALFGAFTNRGQICMGTERLLVDARIADELLERLTPKVKALADGADCPGILRPGPLIDRAAARRMSELVDDARSLGARVLAGGASQGMYFPPTLIDGVMVPMRLYAEESFGPLLSVIRFETINEAIRIANDTEYGLAAAVFGRDTSRAMRVARRVESGICHINGPTVHDEPHMPFGGVKESGYGRFGGSSAIDEFTEMRWLTVREETR